MNKWHEKLASKTIDFSPGDVAELILQMPDGVQGDIVIEILCRANSRCIKPVLEWIDENRKDLEEIK